MKKIVALILAAMMLVAVFASCGESGGDTPDTISGNSGSDSGSTTYENAGKGFDANVTAEDFGDEQGAKLKVWGPEAYVDLLTKQCEAFKKKFADQDISIEIVPQEEDSAATQMQTDAKEGADVFGFASDQFTNLINAGILSSINPVYAADVEKTNDKNSVKISKAYNKSKKTDSLYAFPETGNGYFLVYDKRVVTDDQAKRFEDVLEACKKADKRFIMDAGNGYYACMFAFTGGLRLDGLDSKGKQKFAYAEDKKTGKKKTEKDVAASMQAFSKLMHQYKGTFLSDNVSTIASGFTSQKVAAGIDGNWDTEPITTALGEKNFGAAKLPTIEINGKDTQIVSMYGYKMIGVNGNTDYPRTSQILAYYLASEECQKQRAEQLGWSPTNDKVAESKSVTSNVAVKALLDQSAFSVPQANIAAAIWDPFKSLGNALIADDTNPDSYDFEGLLKSTISSIQS